MITIFRWAAFFFSPPPRNTASPLEVGQVGRRFFRRHQLRLRKRLQLAGAGVFFSLKGQRLSMLVPPKRRQIAL